MRYASAHDALLQHPTPWIHSYRGTMGYNESPEAGHATLVPLQPPVNGAMGGGKQPQSWVPCG